MRNAYMFICMYNMGEHTYVRVCEMHICSYVCRIRANIRMSEVCEMHICSYVCRLRANIRMSKYAKCIYVHTYVKSESHTYVLS